MCIRWVIKFYRLSDFRGQAKGAARGRLIGMSIRVSRRDPAVASVVLNVSSYLMQRNTDPFNNAEF